MGQVYVFEAIVHDAVSRTDHKKSAIFRAIYYIAAELDVGRMRSGITVIHHDPEMAVGIIGCRVTIRATVTRDCTIVEAIKIDALSVHFVEMIAVVSGIFYIAGGIDSNWYSPFSTSTISNGYPISRPLLRSTITCIACPT